MKQCFCIVSGRSLRWAPVWQDDEFSVLFDAASGDYWILSQACRAVVSSLIDKGPQQVDELVQHLTGVAEGLIEELSRSGIIHLTSSETSTPIRMAVDTID